ncbi:S1C family serine protease [Leptolyngbya sp. AN03gr2]|uniref:S1C family serine protease n=1 Tax=unclassified Leptolyngbya TaxID=2650499 RepID=UPI003D324369
MQSRKHIASVLIPIATTFAMLAGSEFIPTHSRLIAVAASKSASERVAEKASSATVSIRTQSSEGSGIILQSNGLVLTNAHVVGRDRTVTIVLQNGTQFVADVVALGQNCVDLALIQIRNAPNLPSLALAENQSLHLGQPVYAIGNPFGYSGSFSEGVVSRIAEDKIQTSVPLNPGNSGGPLLNADGAIVGVNTSIRSDARGISFAIAVSQVRAFLQDYRSGKLQMTAVGADQPDATPIAIRYPETLVSGRLTVQSSAYCRNGSYYDAYDFQAEAGQAVLVRMQSQSFPPVVALLDSDGKLIAENNNPQNETRSVLILRLPKRGTYRVVANAQQRGQQGAYVLTVMPLLLFREGNLQPGDPTFANNNRFQAYEFQGQPNQQITIVASSQDFEPRLYLLDPKNIPVPIKAQQNSADMAVSSVRLPRSGKYTAIVTSAQGKQQGRFLLVVR